MWHALFVRDVPAGFWWGKLKEGENFENLDIYGNSVLRWILQKRGGKTWDWIYLGQVIE
jgi:hypothetical protein